MDATSRMIGSLIIVGAIPYLLGAYVAFSLMPVHRPQAGLLKQVLLSLTPQWFSHYHGAHVSGALQAAGVSFIVFGITLLFLQDSLPSLVRAWSGQLVVLSALGVGWLVSKVMSR
jgi:hypothetical protein